MRSGSNCFRVNLHYGYMQETNIPKTLANARYDQLGFFYEPLQISYFLSRKTVVPSSKPGMPHCGGRNCSPGWCAAPPPRWISSACPSTVLWNWERRSRSEEGGRDG